MSVQEFGDWAAESLHLGTGYATIMPGAVFALILALGRQSRWRTKIAYWSATIAVRAAGQRQGIGWPFETILV